MEEQNVTTKPKGGRPPKAIKRNQLMAMKCTLYERKVIEANAKSVNLTVSEYLREVGLTQKIDRRDKVLPKILGFTAMLNHLAANLNQLAKKRNGNDELSPLERAALKMQSGQLKEIAVNIKSFLQ